MRAYYNEIDPFAAQWLRNLIGEGFIASGDVDERSIVDIRPADLQGYEQCHFFAGIGGWSYALRLAGWPDDRPIWTGSCPCQPFSTAGAGKAADDKRHLWPAWLPLIAQCRPPVIFGEQVEAAIGWGWLDAVFADLEAQGYACGATVLPACGIGAPHIRQRMWFVAESLDDTGSSERLRSQHGEARRDFIEHRRELCSMACADGGNASAEGLQRGREHGQRQEDGRSLCLDDTPGARFASEGDGQPRESEGRRSLPRMGRETGELVNAPGEQTRLPGRARQPGIPAWADADWLPCTDGKARPVEPGTFPLAHGIPKRMGRLRAYGNAIVPQVAAEFIRAAEEMISA